MDSQVSGQIERDVPLRLVDVRWLDSNYYYVACECGKIIASQQLVVLINAPIVLNLNMRAIPCLQYLSTVAEWRNYAAGALSFLSFSTR